MLLSDLNTFEPMAKIPRLNRRIIITEKIDGTNASIHITDDGFIRAASRTRWITIQEDNYGFAAWVEANREELLKLGPGRHFGEWYGRGINRSYNLPERRFALFNVGRWNQELFEAEEALNLTRHNPNPVKQFFAPPACCEVVPVLYSGFFSTEAIGRVRDALVSAGSRAVLGFMNPEGIVIYHTAAKQLFKITITGDEHPKSA